MSDSVLVDFKGGIDIFAWLVKFYNGKLLITCESFADIDKMEPFTFAIIVDMAERKFRIVKCDTVNRRFIEIAHGTIPEGIEYKQIRYLLNENPVLSEAQLDICKAAHDIIIATIRNECKAEFKNADKNCKFLYKRMRSGYNPSVMKNKAKAMKRNRENYDKACAYRKLIKSRLASLN